MMIEYKIFANLPSKFDKNNDTERFWQGLVMIWVVVLSDGWKNGVVIIVMSLLGCMEYSLQARMERSVWHDKSHLLTDGFGVSGFLCW